MDPYVYSFRFCCDPDFNDQRELESLDRFVEEAAVDDVAVFCNVEEINTGHMTAAEQERYLKLLEDVKRVLEPHGVTLSVNHWHSLMHADLGKRMSEALPFRPMVDVEGSQAQLCVCPLDTAWQDHLAALYRRYAALRPHILWVEDDFRFHNHVPWSGGAASVRPIWPSTPGWLATRSGGRTSSRGFSSRGSPTPIEKSGWTPAAGPWWRSPGGWRRRSTPSARRRGWGS